MKRIGDGCGSDDEARDADALDIIDDVDIGDDGIDDEGLSRRSEPDPPPPRDDAMWVRGVRREGEGAAAAAAAGGASSSSSADGARDDAASSEGGAPPRAFRFRDLIISAASFDRRTVRTMFRKYRTQCSSIRCWCVIQEDAIDGE